MTIRIGEYMSASLLHVEGTNEQGYKFRSANGTFRFKGAVQITTNYADSSQLVNHVLSPMAIKIGEISYRVDIVFFLTVVAITANLAK